jgi:photosystem II stability/assembly factor-like uncharacterized protein
MGAGVRHNARVGAALALLACAAAALAAQTMDAWVDPATAPAELEPLASKSLLLDIARSAGHYLTVGARGDVLLSDDGERWRQVEVPTRSTLTALAAVDAQAWAVGHDGMILHSADGGEHWQIQRSDPWQAADAGGDPAKGAPLLDVLFTSVQRGFAIGAYSLALQTSDGGATWQPMAVAAPATDAAGAGADEVEPAKAGDGKETFTAEELKVGEEPTPHLNGIARTGSGALFIVAERGSAFRSRDDGASWQRLQLPYDGSMFGVLGFDGDHVLAFGLRGHAYESTDLGEHWNQVATGTELSLLGGAALADGGAVIVGANGIVLARAAAGAPLASHVAEGSGILVAALPQASAASLLLAGENGIASFELH